MIKKTLHFSNPAYLSISNKQLVISLKETDSEIRVPVEDVGVIILEHPQITITHSLLSYLLEENIAVITSGTGRMPSGMLLPFEGHSSQTERLRVQLDASQPLKKNLWQQTVQAKILNQAWVLKSRGIDTENMLYWSRSVKSGDSENHEGRAAAYYWSHLFPGISNFRRGRSEAPPNNLLNYGYAILRSIVARSIVGSGMHPSVGLHHRNKYNAFCLADDIMEPYRPFVDLEVIKIVESGITYSELTKDHKTALMKVAQVDTKMEGITSPLMVAVQRTTASLFRCFESTQRKITYPAMNM